MGKWSQLRNRSQIFSAEKFCDHDSVSLEARDIPAPGTKAENPLQADVSVCCAPARNRTWNNSFEDCCDIRFTTRALAHNTF